MQSQKQVELINKNNFSIQIEKLVCDNNSTYMETILEYCDDNDIPYEDIRNYISQSLKDKLEYEASNRNYIVRSSRLPVN